MKSKATRIVEGQSQGIAKTAMSAGITTSAAGLISYACVLFTMTTLALDSREGSELRSVLLPQMLLCTGVSLLFSIPSQIRSSIGSPYPGSNTRRRSALWIGSIVVIFLILGLGVYGYNTFALHGLGNKVVGSADTRSMFYASMGAVFMFVGISDFFEAHLRGKRKYLLAASLVVNRGAITSILFWLYLSKLDGNMLMLPVFYIAGPAISIIFAYFLVYSGKRGSVAESRIVDMRKLVVSVGSIILMSYILMSFVTSVQLNIIRLWISVDAEIAFAGILTAQTLLVVGASGMASGVSSTLLSSAAGGIITRNEILSISLKIQNALLALSVLIGVATYLAAPSVIVPLLGQTNVSHYQVSTSWILLFASVLLSNNVFAITVVEEVGLAKLGLYLNLSYFGVMLIMVACLSAAFHSLFWVVIGLVALNALCTIFIRVIVSRIRVGNIPLPEMES